MLSFLTGNKIQEWLRLQSKRAKNLNARQQIKQSNGQYYLRSKFSIFENKDFAYPEGLLNQTVHLDIPIPNSFIESLRDGDPVTEEDLQQHLKQLRAKFYIPKLSLIRIGSLYIRLFCNALEINSLLTFLLVLMPISLLLLLIVIKIS